MSSELASGGKETKARSSLYEAFNYISKASRRTWAHTVFKTGIRPDKSSSVVFKILVMSSIGSLRA